MNWTNFAYWLRLIDELRAWLLGFRPEFLHANRLVHAIFIFAMVNFSLWLIVKVINLAAFTVYEILSMNRPGFGGDSNL